MGLTERHWFEDEEPELTERQLEDMVYENEKAYNSGYVKGFHDAKTLEAYLIEFGVKIGFLTLEKAKQLSKGHPQIVRCKECDYACNYSDIYKKLPFKCTISGKYRNADWFCADGKRKEGGGE